MGWTWIKKCPVFCVLTVSGLLFSLVGIAGRFSMYRGYDFQMAKQPFLALMMEGIDEGVMPWEAVGFPIVMGSETKETSAGAGGKGQNIEDFMGEASEPDGTGATGALESSGADSYAAGSVPDGGDMTADSVTGGGNGAGPEVDGGSDGGSGLNSGSGQGQSMDGKALADSGSDGGNQEEGTGRMDSSAGERDAAETQTEGGLSYGFQEVSEEYFDDAVFIGDSRTVGLYEYGGIEMRADFFAKISLTIYDVFTEKVAKDEETGKRITVEEALQKKQYGKVYLMLGINELGTGTTESFMEEYTEVVGRIRELQPDAVIFVEGIMRVTGAKDENDPIFNNTNINEKNDAIAGLANNRDIFYIDVNEVVCDENGNLNAEYTTDDVHLKAKYYEIWKDFLLKHGVKTLF